MPAVLLEAEGPSEKRGSCLFGQTAAELSLSQASMAGCLTHCWVLVQFSKHRDCGCGAHTCDTSSGRLRWEDGKCETSLGYSDSSVCL